MNLENKLKEFFSFSSFRPGQKETISSILKGDHTLSMLPTGTGKSLCFQFPGLFLDGAVIIISPLLSLMQDQVEQMKMNGEKRVVALNSFLSKKERDYSFTHIKKYKFIYISPEMISSSYVLNLLKTIKIALFVVDEAHCISQWGYDFRPEYKNLGNVRKELNSPLTLALTATATSEIREDIKKSLFLEEVTEIIYPVNRPNIALAVEKFSTATEKLERLYTLVKQLQGPGIIYFSSKKIAEQTASYIRSKSNKKISGYHGGMTQEDRILIQQQFLHGHLEVICATSAFGMGVNKENIRYVIHYHMPTQMESFLQEIGRAGRDGLDSISILLYANGDEALTSQLIEMELASDMQIDQLLASLSSYRSYQDWKEKEQEWRQFVFSETQWRVLEAYFLSEIADMPGLIKKLHRFKQHRLKRVEIKRQKIAALLTWINKQECRRTFIADYFHEKKPESMERCCDKCGLDLSFYHQKRTFIEKKHNEGDWKKMLAQILLQRDSYDE
ncbi:ATP-dependent DNA helicase RecQ [Niallia sp. NCCP-28]|uniref:RecQ family ATP-dependent DNA helicase n=1 Tax=Niallia sp. NCCP-28 TaxID=2934712 RepID=UPI002085DFA0|nr:RecQ family ATP-dependent DNA helicase [Niallia sp. NCCP-28]GKU81039.1 ATP-dependent DNA helicase [Niallia sp. NCCP-28]